MKVPGYPFWARALETACSACILVTADDMRASAREYKVRIILGQCTDIHSAAVNKGMLWD